MGAIRRMNFLHSLCTLLYIASIGCIIIGSKTISAADALPWFHAAMGILILQAFLPIGPVFWLAAVICVAKECRKPAFKAAIGYRWLWLIFWPLLHSFLLCKAIFLFIKFTGGV